MGIDDTEIAMTMVRKLNRRELIIVHLWRQYPALQPLNRLRMDDCGGPAASLRIYEINKRRAGSIVEPEKLMYTLYLPYRRDF